MAVVAEVATPEVVAPDGVSATPIAAGFARNSMGSLLRTASGAFLALLLPPLLIRRLGTEPYGVWAIGVEIGTYLALLDLGALSAMGHFTAGLADEDDEGRGRVVSTMLAVQCALVAAGAVVLVALVACVPLIWSRMPDRLVGEARWTLGLIGASSLLSLLATALSGYFLAIHRVVVPAAITFGSRAIGAVAVAVLALRGGGIAELAVAWAVATVVGHVAIGVAFGRLRIPVRRTLVAGPLARRMVAFCGAYGVWTLAAVLVTGLDTTIVARLDFSAVAPYAAAAGAVAVLTAVYGSALAPLVPLSARLAATGRTDELDDVFLRLVRWGAAAVVTTGAFAVLACPPILRAWLGGATAARSVPLLQVLVAANALRLLTFPYPVVLFGTGEHRRARWTPLIEGVVNVAASAVLGMAIGPIGVAVGTLLGSVACVSVHLFVNLPATRSLSVRAGTVVRRSLAGPVLVAVPAGAAFALRPFLAEATWPALVASAVALTALLAWTVALAAEDRTAVRTFVAARLHRVHPDVSSLHPTPTAPGAQP